MTRNGGQGYERLKLSGYEILYQGKDNHKDTTEHEVCVACEGHQTQDGQLALL